MTINNKYALSRDYRGRLQIHQPTVNGWETSYNPDTNSLCVHNAEGDIVRAYRCTDKLGGDKTPKAWAEILYYCRSHNPPT